MVYEQAVVKNKGWCANTPSPQVIQRALRRFND